MAEELKLAQTVMAEKLSKPPMALVPKVMMEEMAKAFGDGANKHGLHAYKTGKMTVTQALSAAIRHIQECLDGEDTVPDSPSKCHHLGAVGAEIAIALWLIKNKGENDDRFRKE